MTEQEIRKKFLKIGQRFGKIKMLINYGNVSKAEFAVLITLKRRQEMTRNENGVYVSQLARELKISSPAVSRMLGNLESKGLIGRNVDKENRRNTYVYLTAQGEEEIAETERLLDEAVTKVVRQMGKEDVEQLLNLWEKMVCIMEENAGTMISDKVSNHCSYISHEFLIKEGKE